MNHPYAAVPNSATFQVCPQPLPAFTALQVGGRIISKRIHVRVEHVQPSRCREDFLKRRAANDAAKTEAKKQGGEYTRTPAGQAPLQQEGDVQRGGDWEMRRGCERASEESQAMLEVLQLSLHSGNQIPKWSAGT